MNYHNKYLKYKEKYFELKQNGGNFMTWTDIIENSDEKIEESCDIINNIISEYSNTPFDSIIFKDIFANNIVNYIKNNINNLFWVLNYNKIYNVTVDRKYFFNKYKVLQYYIVKSQTNITLLQKNFYINIETPDFDIENLYTYSLEGNIFGKKIDLFNSVYCNDMNIILYHKIKEWILLKMKKYNKIIKIYDRIIFDNRLCNQLFLEGSVDKKQSLIFKVHLNIKLENLFWTIEKIIYNFDLFKKYIGELKFALEFSFFRFNKENVNKSIYENTYIINKQKYKNEEENPIVIVFYPLDDNPVNGVYNNMKELINILKKLFDDKYQLQQEFFPRLNFRINNTLFFALGDSGKKLDYLDSKRQNKPTSNIFYQPKDYVNLNCKIYDPKSCKIHNEITKKIHNHELCKLNEHDECINNNIYQYNILIIPEFQGYTIEEIYRTIGQEEEYCKLN